jgi:hypothetical protein
MSAALPATKPCRDCGTPIEDRYNAPTCEPCRAVLLAPTRARLAARPAASHAPSREGSATCRNFARTGHGAIAAGGTVEFCTCAGCF